MIDSSEFVTSVMVLLAVASLSFFGRFLWRFRTYRFGTIRLSMIEDNPLTLGWRLRVRRIRYGRDEHDFKSNLVVKDFDFKRVSKEEYKASIFHDASKGFQFKCFLELPSGALDDAREWLESQSFVEITTDSTRKRFLWFIVPNFTRCFTADTPKPYENNYFDTKAGELMFQASVKT